jgi:hypothetical protein
MRGEAGETSRVLDGSCLPNHGQARPGQRVLVTRRAVEKQRDPRVERGHLVAGFGRVHWTEGCDLLFAADTAALAAAEPEILRHMNEHHADAVADYARGLLGRAGADWRMTGIDPEGADLQCDGEIARLDFPAPVMTPAAARAAFVELTQKARK